MPFLDAFIKEVETALSELDFWMAFNILDPRALSEELDLLDEHRVDELDKHSSLIMAMTNLIFTMVTNHVKKLI